MEVGTDLEDTLPGSDSAYRKFSHLALFSQPSPQWPDQKADRAFVEAPSIMRHPSIGALLHGENETGRVNAFSNFRLLLIPSEEEIQDLALSLFTVKETVGYSVGSSVLF